jgi:uncharacterized protein
MTRLRCDDPVALSLTQAILSGDIDALNRLLEARPGIASARILKNDASRSLLHIATDWPGHFPNSAATVAALVAAGADPNVRCEGMFHTETPLHWTASNDDLAAFEALVKAGADIEADGGSIGGGTPLDDAVGYGQWIVARRLVELGAHTRFWHEAALGLIARVAARFAADAAPSAEEIDNAFYQACHGGQREAAEYLLARGANINWIPSWGKDTALDVARAGARAGNLVDWLLDRGAKSATELD